MAYLPWAPNKPFNYPKWHPDPEDETKFVELRIVAIRCKPDNGPMYFKYQLCEVIKTHNRDTNGYREKGYKYLEFKPITEFGLDKIDHREDGSGKDMTLSLDYMSKLIEHRDRLTEFIDFVQQKVSSQSTEDYWGHVKVFPDDFTFGYKNEQV